ncbi:MAG: DNA/RNA non-specific endonuclease [Bacteroidota bacterium]|nr:DNA/RNA non-specific endonuclease [Bacteroidota bacterium]
MKNRILSFSIALAITLLPFLSNPVFCQSHHSAKATSTTNVNMALGNPSNATTSTVNANNYLMQKPQYCLSYNNKNHIPNWVSWHVQTSDIGPVDRKNDFRPDDLLPANWYHVSSTDYIRSGFDRGHQCPSADRTSYEENNSATFLMTNMIPQAPNNNRITWMHLESYCRSLVFQGNELYIICGVYGQGGIGSAKPDIVRTLQSGVTVPAQTWKIIVVLPSGENDLSRITTQTRVIAVLMPNTQDCSKHPWQNYRVSVDSIEHLSGFNFLSNIPENIQKVIESKVDNTPVNKQI